MKRFFLFSIVVLFCTVCSAQYARLRNLDQQLFSTQDTTRLALLMYELGRPVEHWTEDGIYYYSIANVTGTTGHCDLMELDLEMATGAQAYFFSEFVPYNPHNTNIVETKAKNVARHTRKSVFYKSEPWTERGKREYRISIVVCNDMFARYYSPEKDGYTCLY